MAAAVCVIWKKRIDLSKGKRQPNLVAAEGEYPIRKRYSQPTRICFLFLFLFQRQEGQDGICHIRNRHGLQPNLTRAC